MSALSVEYLTKKYADVTAVDRFSFHADPQEIVALVGPDGAGKTSLFRSVCGLIEFDSGSVEIMDHDLGTEFESIKEILGYMPQVFSLYPDLSVEENLRFYAGIFGLDRGEYDVRKEPLYEFSGLGPFRSRRAGNLSGGMKQKLALCCALIHDPPVLILDEPTTGVDPLSRRQFWEILKRLRKDGSTIVVSTPYMDEVELADRAVFIHCGRKLAEGTPRELAREYMGSVYRIDIEATVERVRELSRIAGVDLRRFGSCLHAYISAATGEDEFRKKFAEQGIDSDRIEKIEAGLEDTFIQLMGR